jgi:hypothetical protein
MILARIGDMMDESQFMILLEGNFDGEEMLTEH